MIVMKVNMTSKNLGRCYATTARKSIKFLAILRPNKFYNLILIISSSYTIASKFGPGHLSPTIIFVLAH